jgi:hypothetical protein
MFFQNSVTKKTTKKNCKSSSGYNLCGALHCEHHLTTMLIFLNIKYAKWCTIHKPYPPNHEEITTISKVLHKQPPVMSVG